jgi:hypothetical protein
LVSPPSIPPPEHLLDAPPANAVARLDTLEFLSDVVPRTTTFKQFAEERGEDYVPGSDAQLPSPEELRAMAEAERLAAEAKTRMEDFIARRTKMAEAKIAQAEAQALADVRAAAADAAVAAAGKILSATAKGQVADDLLKQSIEDVKQRFN